MNLKCRNRIFFIILMLFLCDICISFADDVVDSQMHDANAKQILSNRMPENKEKSQDEKNTFSLEGKPVSYVNNKIIHFKIQSALNIKFNDMKPEDEIELLHSNDEYQELYNKFLQQNIRADARKKLAEIQEDDDYTKDVNLKLLSLYYYNDNDWGCKINNRFIKKSNQNDAHGNVSIVKVNKDSVLFVLNKTKEDDIVKIKKLKQSNYKYSSDYYIVKNGNMKSVMFRLHIGQSINLKSFQIK